MSATRIVSLLILSALIVGCGSTPSSVAPVERVTQIKPVEEAPIQVSPDTKLELAAQATSDAARNRFLLEAADLFKYAEDCNSADTILDVLEDELTEQSDVSYARLIQAECELTSHAPDYSKLLIWLPDLNQNREFDTRAAAVNAAVLYQQGRVVTAAESLAEAGIEEYSSQIWMWLQSLNDAQLNQARLRSSRLGPFLQLALITRRYGTNPKALSENVNDWLRQNPEHPLALSLPEEVQLAMTTQPIVAERVAVLLPLTGRLSTQGQAIKNGMVAAYMASKKPLPEKLVEPETDELTDSAQEEGHIGISAIETAPRYPELHFFNSALKSPADMAEMVVGYDVVIGPLLKDNIGELSLLLPEDTTLLALNRVDSLEKPLTGEQYYFALAPEDEAVQLAQHVRDQNYKNPVIVSSMSGVPERMTEAFLRHWQDTSAEGEYSVPSVARFTDTKSMREGVSNLLDVAQSKDRITQIENLLSQQLYSVPRNRRDIDAIIIFASPEQTELLNPIIESSMSPFSDKVVPVYASSRSFSREFSRNSLRDLRNLTFTDMPWMLPDNPWSSMGTELDTLFPGQNSVLRRLFALGYDSWQVLPQLRHMRIMPYLTFSGMTGELSIDTGANLQRKLPWGKVTNSEVIMLAMD